MLESLQREHKLPSALTPGTVDKMSESLARYFSDASKKKLKEFADKAKEVAEATLKGEGGVSQAEGRSVLTDFLEQASGQAVGELMDVGFFLRVAGEVAAGAGAFAAQNWDQDRVDAYPALEFYRVYERDVPRGSQKDPKGPENAWDDDEGRWAAACDEAGDDEAAEVFDSTGRCVALKSSGVWQALGDGAGDHDDTLGNPFPPFAFNSGWDVREVSHDECVELGLMDEGDEAEPAKFDFSDLLALDSRRAALPGLCGFQTWADYEAWAELRAGEWREELHPRDKGGKFASEEGRTGEKEEKAEKQEKAAEPASENPATIGVLINPKVSQGDAFMARTIASEYFPSAEKHGVRIKIFAEGDSLGSFNQGGKTFTRAGMYDPQTKQVDSRVSPTTMAHELGHAELDYAMSEDIKGLQEYFDKHKAAGTDPFGRSASSSSTLVRPKDKEVEDFLREHLKGKPDATPGTAVRAFRALGKSSSIERLTRVMGEMKSRPPESEKAAGPEHTGLDDRTGKFKVPADARQRLHNAIEDFKEAFKKPSDYPTEYARSWRNEGITDRPWNVSTPTYVGNSGSVPGAPKYPIPYHVGVDRAVNEAYAEFSAGSVGHDLKRRGFLASVDDHQYWGGFEQMGTEQGRNAYTALRKAVKDTI